MPFALPTSSMISIARVGVGGRFVGALFGFDVAMGEVDEEVVTGPAVITKPDGDVEGHTLPGPPVGVKIPVEGPIWQVHRPLPSCWLGLLHVKVAVADSPVRVIDGADLVACELWMLPNNKIDGFNAVFGSPEPVVLAAVELLDGLTDA